MSRKQTNIKAAISLPDRLFDEVEATAKDLGVSRSKLIRAALEDFLQRRRGDAFAEAIDRYVAKHGSGLSEEGEPWLAHHSGQGRRAQRRDESKRTASRKTVMSFPTGLFDEIVGAAKDLGLSRSDFVCIALSDFLIRHNSSETTRLLNRSHIKHPPEPDPFLDYLTLEVMRRTE